MRVLYVVTKGNWGGAQRYVFDLATAAKARGFDVAVAYGHPGRLEHELLAAGIRTIPLSIKNEPSFGAIVKAKDELYKIFKEEKPDVVHLNSSLVGIGGAWAARAARVPKVIFTNHGWIFKESRSFFSRIMLWDISWVTALLVDQVISVSDYEQRLTEKFPLCRNKAIRIYNGIDLNMQWGSGEVIRSAFPSGVKITGTVGDLTKNKNQIALIERAKIDPSVNVAIVGEGELRSALQDKIQEYKLQDRVKLFGFLPVADVMKGFDSFALPSIKEGLGYVILEARAAGLPINANRVGGVSEAMDLPLEEFSKEKMAEQTLAVYRK